MDTSEKSITWENNPWIVKQITPWIGLSEYYSALLLILFGSPFFHWWILEELLRTCRKQLSFYPARVKNHLIQVVVHIRQDNLNRALSLYGFSDKEKFLSALSQWMTEQIQSYLISEDKALQWPLVCVECIPADQTPGSDLLHVVFPENEKQFIKMVKIFFSSSVMKVLNNIFLLNRQNMELDVYSRLDYPFWFEFSDKNPSCDINLSVVVPSGGYKIPSDHSSFQIGMESLGKDENITKTCVLVSPQHVQIVVVTFASRKKEFFFVRHIGENESWVLENEMSELIPRDGWKLLPSGCLLVLGRMVKAKEFLTRNVVLPGSMVIQIP